MKLRLENVLSSEELPSLPEVAHQILLLAQDTTASVDDLADAVKADPAMSAKILRTANSAFFGRQYKITSVRAAIPVLGATLIRTLVLGFSLTRNETWNRLEEAYRKIWRRALIQAVTTELLAKHVEDADPEAYFVAGLIQDVGVLALARTSPEEYLDEVFSQATVLNLPSAEKKHFSFTHVDVSVAYCSNWKLDTATIAAIRDHHEPLSLLRKDRRSTQLGQALKLASHWAAHIEAVAQSPSREIRTAMSRSFGIDGDGIDQFLIEVHQRVEDAAGVFAIDIGTLPPIHEILGRAKLVIEDIAIQSQLEAAEAKKDVIKVRDRLEMVESRSRHFEQEMFTDPLTGVYNRRLLEAGMETEIAYCREQQKPMGVLFLDLDKFKPLNDICGHDAGDRALQLAATVLKDSLREGDLVIRYGGDEFLVVFIDVSMESLGLIAERVCKQVQTSLRYVTELVSASASVGAIHCPAESVHHLDIASLIREVDRLMYEAKQRGGNQVCLLGLEALASSSSETP